MQETGKIEQQERIYIIQPIFDDTYPVWEKETISLIESAGASHAGTIRQKIREVNSATVIGPGKMAELSARLEGLDVTVLYNGDLSPTQTLNISQALGDKKVIDRTTLILDIFAKNAKTNEGKLQGELAMLQSIGMTAKQLRRMLVVEGLLYTLGAVALAAVLVLAISPFAGEAVGGLFFWFSYRPTYWPLAVAAPVFAAVGVLIPLASVHRMQRNSVVDRLREE